MPQININLNLQILPENLKVYMVRPGGNYHLYSKFRELSLIAPDFPLLELPDGRQVKEAPHLELQLNRAVVFRAWQKKSRGKRVEVPARSLDAYALTEDISTAGRTRLTNIAQQILTTIPEGSVVFVPAGSLYGEALIGEVCSADAPRIDFKGDGYRKVLGYKGRALRNVKVFPMRSFPPEVTDLAKLPSVIQEYEGYACERILRSYYGDYQLGDAVAMMEFEALSEHFDPITMARLTALAVSIEEFEKNGVYREPGSLLFSSDLETSLEVHAAINSKNGKLLLEGIRKVPHVLRALLLCASLVSSGQATADEVTRLFVNGAISVHNAKEAQPSEFVQATQTSIINFGRAAGYEDSKSYIIAMAQSLQRSQAQIEGEVSIAP